MARTTVLRSIGLLLSLTLATTVGVVSTAAPADADADSPVVILYGDSLAWESQDHFVAAVTLGTDAAAIGRSFGGTALCDYLDIMREDAVDAAPGRRGPGVQRQPIHDVHAPRERRGHGRRRRLPQVPR